MKQFMDEEFLLSTGTAVRLYRDVAKELPIIDYHCHLSPREIFEDQRYENITQLWLGADHYKWRLMRSFGVEERYVTGAAPDREKFQKWAEALSLAIGNPLYHWSHLELKNYFGYDGVLNGKTAETVWRLCNEKLAAPEFSARSLILRSRVEALCTTDDPADSLEWHEKLTPSCRFERSEEPHAATQKAFSPQAPQNDNPAGRFNVKVLPSFRPDLALCIEKADYSAYLEKLSAAADCEIRTFADLCEALERRAEFFDRLGCRGADHGLAAVPYAPAAEAQVEAIFQKRRAGAVLSAQERAQYQTALLLFLGRLYARLGWVMQIHFGVIRNNAGRVFRAFGPDAGIDSIGDTVSITALAAFLNALDETDELPKTILYPLDPKDNTAVVSVMGCFQQGGIPGKLQLGSAWWFNDHVKGMRNQLTDLAAGGHLATFVGMLTDSRSFLSYARHEYFRRILCDLLGAWVENGEYPNDDVALRQIVEGICYRNVKAYFGQ